MEPAIKRDGPGSLVFGETLLVKGVAEWMGDGIVAFSVFGTHTEVEIIQHNEGVTASVAKPGRHLGRAQKKYVEDVALFIMAISLGWIDCSEV